MFAFLTYRVLAWIAAGLAVTVLSLTAVLWAAGVRIDAVKVERDRARDQVKAALFTIDGQKRTLQECSDRTDALKADSDKRAAQAAQELARAQKEASKYQAATKRIEALRLAPSPTGAKCEVALQAIRRELRK